MSGLVSAFLQSYHKYEKFIPLCVDFWLSPYILVSIEGCTLPTYLRSYIANNFMKSNKKLRAV